MSDNDLNLNFDAEHRQNTPTAEPTGAKPSIFKFDPRTVIIWVLLKWRWILIAFLVALISFWSVLQFQSSYSKKAWSAGAKIFHQTRSERIPSFYKPVDTTAVMQFISSHDVFVRAAEKLKREYPQKFSKDLFKFVEIGVERGRKSVIYVRTTANTPELAVDMANTLAQEGISEYVRRQNNSMKVMSEERKQQRKEVDGEIDAIQDEKKSYYSAKSGLPPDLELEKVLSEISNLMSKRDESNRSLLSIESRIVNVENLIKVTPKNIEYETVVDNSRSIGLDGKKNELQRLRKRYTEENPKVMILVSEIEDMEREKAAGAADSPARVIYRKNEIYSGLEAQLSNLNLEKSMLATEIKHIDIDVEKKRVQMEKLQEKLKAYSAILRRENALTEKSKMMAGKINDIEFLITSALPDVSLLEAAKTPYYNMKKIRLKIAALTFATTFMFILGLSVFRIAKMKFLSSTEFKTALGIENWGEIPLAKDFDESVQMSALQTVSRNIKIFSANSKRVAFLKFNGDETLEDSIEQLLDIASVKGFKSFRLKCVAADKIGDYAERKIDEADTVANTLISTKKFANLGIFQYQNKYCLDVVETDLLGFDINVLSRDYDLIIIEVDCSSASAQLSTQISHLSDYVIVSAAFDKTGKFEVLENIEQIKSTSGAEIGGLLVNVSKPYFRK